jgi:hypothetical protein
LDENTGRPSQPWLQWLLNPSVISINLGSALGVTSGGTGLTTIPTNGQLLIGNGTGYTLNTLGFGAGISVTNGSGTISVANTGVLSFSAGTTGLTPSTATTGVVSLAGTLIAVNGGTGFSSYAVGDLLYADTTTTLAKLPDVATGNALISGGVSTAPIWGKIGLTTHVSGILPIANGGTNSTATPTAYGISYGTGTAYDFTAAGTDKQVLRANTGAAPTWTTLTTGTSILYGDNTGGFSNVTIGSGVSFVAGTLSATGSGGTVTSVTGTAPVVSSGGATPAISLAAAYGDTLNPYAAKTANYVLAGPATGAASVPLFRALVAADIPSLPYGTVTSVSGTGTVSGISLSGTVTSSGSLTLGGTLDLSSPPAIGSTAANTGAFTTLSASSTVSGTGFTTYLASPPAIGGTAAAAGTFTTVTATTVNIAASAANAGLTLLRDTGTATRSSRIFLDASGGVTAIYNNSNSILFNTSATIGSSSGANQFLVSHTASAVNYVQVTGATTASKVVAISAQGSDTDVTLSLSPKGAGTIRFGTYTASALLAVAGYITITDSGGTSRRLLVG